MEDEKFLMASFKHVKTGFVTFIVIKSGQPFPDLPGYKPIKVNDFNPIKPNMESDTVVK